MKKRFFALLLAVVMLLAMVPLGASAATATSGKCGDNLTWTLAGDTLTISGTGPMQNYDMSTTSKDFTNLATLTGGCTTAIIEHGVTTIGDDAFAYCNETNDRVPLETVIIGDTVTTIGEVAFGMCDALERIYIPVSVTEMIGFPFMGCNGLRDIFYGGTMEQWAKFKMDFPDKTVIHYNCKGIPTEGIGGEHVTWKLNGATLNITGTGEMGDFNYGLSHSTAKFTSAVIGSGVTSIGLSAFDDTPHLTSVTIPASVTKIADFAFNSCPALKDVYFGGTEAQWKALTVGSYNEDLTRAVIHYAPVFTDVPASAYYAAPVQWAVANNITAGTSSTSFSPEQQCTRAEAMTFLWRAAGRPAPTTTTNPFKDVKASEYYYDAVLWAVENNITAGTTATTFSPNQVCTRAQDMTFLWRYAKKPAPKSTANPFKDVPAGEYYTQAVLWAAEQEITSGTSKTEFSPNQICTRGQDMTFLYNYMVK